MSVTSEFNNRESNRKQIANFINKLGYGQYRTYDVFSDWVEIIALALSNSVDRSQYARREARYLDIVGKYEKKYVAEFPRIMALLVEEFCLGESGINFDDVLGSIYMTSGMGDERRGQFFTPYTISNMMAGITLGDGLKSVLEHKGYICLAEPACGAGGMCIAAAETLFKQGINYQECLHITAQDIDPLCVHMTYVQLSLLHIPAVVILGNSLANEQLQTWYTPAHVLGAWGKRLAGYKANQSDDELITIPKNALDIPLCEEPIDQQQLNQAVCTKQEQLVLF